MPARSETGAVIYPFKLAELGKKSMNRNE